MSSFLPRLPKNFWAYLDGMDQDLERLCGLLEKERLSLLRKDFKDIMTLARQKEELLKRLFSGEERLIHIMREVVKKAGVGEDPTPDQKGAQGIVRAFKEILDFKDLLRFEKWHTAYKIKMNEARSMNLRNQKWAEEGFQETLELSRILSGQRLATSGEKGGAGAPFLYNENGQLNGVDR